MTKLKRTMEQAEEQGRSLEEVGIERYGVCVFIFFLIYILLRALRTDAYLVLSSLWISYRKPLPSARSSTAVGPAAIVTATALTRA